MLDTEGNHQERIKGLVEGRDASLSEFPMAVGAAHPCIEAWLLADAKAIRKGMELGVTPQVPDEPEDLPAPQDDRKHNPKTALAKSAGVTRGELASSEKDKIASAMKDMALICARCPSDLGRLRPRWSNTSGPFFPTRLRIKSNRDDQIFQEVEQTDVPVERGLASVLQVNSRVLTKNHNGQRRILMADTKDKIKEKIDQVADKAKKVTEDVTEKAKEAGQKVGEKVEEAGEAIKKKSK